MLNFSDIFDFCSDQTQSVTRLRILVIDDNATLARLFTMLLIKCGFEVRTLNDGYLALATARAFQPHFVILDIGLPGMNGFDVARQLRHDPELKSTVIIAISAYGPDTFSDRAAKADFNYYLMKPVFLEDLLPLLVLH